jgi:hypothetical protein
VHTWIRWLGSAAAALLLGLSPPAEAAQQNKTPPAKTAAKKANKERQAKPKAREHANFRRAKSCGAASRACLAKCQSHKAPAEHARCVNQGKCDATYAKCMGKTL